ADLRRARCAEHSASDKLTRECAIPCWYDRQRVNLRAGIEQAQPGRERLPTSPVPLGDVVKFSDEMAADHDLRRHWATAVRVPEADRADFIRRELADGTAQIRHRDAIPVQKELACSHTGDEKLSCEGRTGRRDRQCLDYRADTASDERGHR